MELIKLLEQYPILRPWLEHLPISLHKACWLQQLPARYTVHQKDSEIDRVGLLCEGTLRVLNIFASGDAFMIEYDRAVDFIGDVSVLAEEASPSVTIETHTRCTVLWFSRVDFEYWISQSPAFLRMLAKNVARKLYISSYNRGKELFYSSPHRLMDFLIRTLGNIAQPTRLTETRQHIAEQLGMNLKTLDRTILRLKESGLINLERGKIMVTPKQLADIQQELDSLDK